MADPALLLAVQETCKIIIIVKSPIMSTVVTSSSSCPSGTVTNSEFLKFIGAEVSPAKEIWEDLITLVDNIGDGNIGCRQDPPQPQALGFQSWHGKLSALHRQVSPFPQDYHLDQVAKNNVKAVYG